MNKRAVTVSGYVIFCVPFCQMKNQYIFRVIHIQSVRHASALMERGAGDRGLEWGESPVRLS